MFHLDSEMFYDNRVIAIRFNPSNLNDLLSYSESNWKSRTDTSPFNYSFLDEDLEQIYATESKLGGLFTVFTTLAMVIAGVGLFGLASYATVNRSKEIGIRKVLGASTQGLIIMLNSNFSKLVAISVIIAVPVSWFAMDSWLQQFANKISMGWEAFALAGASAFVLAWMIVGFQSLKASLLNPVETLRDE